MNSPFVRSPLTRTSPCANLVDSLVEAGIQGILSFAACHVMVPRKVKVINIDIAIDLASLPYYFASG